MIAHFVCKQWPILQVIIPLFGGIIAALASRYAERVAIISATLSFASSAYGFYSLLSMGERRYVLGNWPSNIGIEYRLDHLSQPIILFLSCVTLFLLVFCRGYLNDELGRVIASKYRHIIYTMLLLVQTGLSGMVATNDLFNLYVFLEIASLSSCALISQGKDKRSSISAFDYLIFSTIGASLILIGIGMLFSVTGGLNIDDLRSRLVDLYNSRIVILGLVFFILGCMMKIALFPLHFWMIRAYKFTASINLVYIAGMSSMVGFYLLIRFIYFVLDYKILHQSFYFGEVLKYTALLAIVFGSYRAYLANEIRELLLYSAAAQVGYIAILFTTSSPLALGIMVSCIFADGILKISLFLSLCGKAPTTLLVFNLLSNAGLPFTIGFLNKFNILASLLSAGEYFAFIIMILTSMLALEYNYKMFKLYRHQELSLKGSLPLLISTLASILLLIFNKQFIAFFTEFFAGVMNG